MRISDWSSDVCSADLTGNRLHVESKAFVPLHHAAGGREDMCRENEGSDTVFRQYRMGAIDKAVDDRHAERRVAKNDGYVLLRQLDASEVSDDDLSAGIGFGHSRSDEHTSELQ